MSDVEQVLLASPRGFCAGVEMAIKALAWMVRAFEPPVYCYHEIVHNQKVVERFEALGVRFVDDIGEVPPGRPVMLSAHGSAPEVVAAARASGGYVADAVCPLVTKVHHEVKTRAAKGYEIVYVGHEGHEEAVGTMAVAPDAIHLAEHPEDVADLAPIESPVALLAQTTLSHRDWADVADAVAERFPDLWKPGRSDLCFATTNRQSALMAMAPRCDAMVVIGSANSSNTRALERLAIDAGCPRVHRVNGAEEIPDDLAGVVGVTAGASAPEELVTAVIATLAPRQGVEEVAITTEDEYFPPPRNLRDLIDAIDAFAGLGFAATADVVPEAADRRLAASDVLAALTEATVLAPDLDTLRLTLHILGAALWVGGQLTVLGLLPVLRELDPDAPRLAARRFAWLAWSGFGLLLVTGVWNLLATDVGATSTTYQVTLALKLVLVALTGVGAALHSIASSKVGLAVWGAVGLLTGIGAVFVGVLLAGG